MARPLRSPPRDYTDLPPWSHNHDNVRVRVVNAAWNALLTRDFNRLTFRELAQEAGIAAPAIYQFIPTLEALGATLAAASLARLRNEMATHPKPLDAFRSFLDFVHRRPHHAALFLSPRFNASPEVKQLRQRLKENLNTSLEAWLGRRPKDGEVLNLQLTLNGGAALLMTDACTANEAMAGVAAALKSMRKAS